MIRRLEEGDVDAVGAVLGLARLHQGDGYYLVEWDGGTPTAHLHLALSDPPEIQDVEVREEWRGRGVARALLAEAEAACARRGCAVVRVSVGIDNEAARALYTSCGYVDAGLPPRRVVGTVQVRTGPLEVDDTLLTLEKALRPPR